MLGLGGTGGHVAARQRRVAIGRTIGGRDEGTFVHHRWISEDEVANLDRERRENGGKWKRGGVLDWKNQMRG
jgi:hypothetical protein